MCIRVSLEYVVSGRSRSKYSFKRVSELLKRNVRATLVQVRYANASSVSTEKLALKR
jgi:hypothetical protein